MTISIKCPICAAGNSLTERNLNCRRCQNDLSHLFAVKYHSYIKRLDVIKFLIQNDFENSKKALQKSVKLSKEI